jgi:hypothetical protein
MAIKNIIAQGIGFSPGGVQFIPTLGFTPGEVALPSVSAYAPNWLSPSMRMGIFLILCLAGDKWAR